MSNKQTHILVFSPMAPTGCSKCNFSGSDLDRYPCPNQDQLNDMQPSDHTSDTERANAPQSTPTLRELVERIRHGEAINGTAHHPDELTDLAVAALESLLSDRIREAETNAVAWAVGVVDDLHVSALETPLDIDREYKHIKNTLRDRYKAETGIDPAPSYPIKAALQEKRNDT